jgi:DNA-binding transcriptional LysR family regulator
LAPALDDIADRLERVRSRKGQASGHLRINASSIALPLALAPVMEAMARRYPDVTVEVVSDEALTDIVGEASTLACAWAR